MQEYFVPNMKSWVDNSADGEVHFTVHVHKRLNCPILVDILQCQLWMNEYFTV